jgi:hypothetical protein
LLPLLREVLEGGADEDLKAPVVWHSGSCSSVTASRSAVGSIRHYDALCGRTGAASTSCTTRWSGRSSSSDHSRDISWPALAGAGMRPPAHQEALSHLSDIIGSIEDRSVIKCSGCPPSEGTKVSQMP